MILSAIWGKVAGWIAAIASLVAGAFGLFLYAKASGEKSQEAKDAARSAGDDAEAARAVTRAVEAASTLKAKTDAEVAKMPEAGAQRVSDAAVGTAAGELRDKFSRDSG